MPTPGATIRGALAGAAATGVMTAAQTAYCKATGAEGSNTPGEVAKRILEGVFGREVADEELPRLPTVMHWLYGTSWGTVLGIAAGSGSSERGTLSRGLRFGLTVWGTSLVHLPAMGLSPPIWKLASASIAPDVGFHVVYGVAASAAWGSIRR